MAHLNLSYIKENVSDEEEFIKELLEIFLEGLKTDGKQLQEAIEAEDHDEIKLAAHKLKSSFRSLGMTIPWNMLQEIEDCGHEIRPMERIRSKKAEFNPLVPEVVAEVRSYLEP